MASKPQALVPDKLPPRSEESEAGVLGCCLLDPQQCLPACVDKGITSELFYNLSNGQIYSTMLKMVDSGKSVDTITLLEELRSAGIEDRVGGVSRLMTLAECVPSAANLPFYLEILLDKATRRELLKASHEIEGLAWNEALSPAEASDQAEALIMAADRTDNQAEMPDMKALVIAVLSSTQKAFENDGKARGLTTGIDTLDKLIPTGMMPGDMICVAGRPSVGKSSLAMQIACHVAKGGHHVGVFSLEMGSESLTARLVAHSGRISLTAVQSGKMTEREMQAFAASTALVSSLPIHIDDRAGVNLHQVRARARRMKSKHNIEFIVLDYLQLMRGSRADMSDQERVSEVSTGVKTLARQLGIPILALVQLNRDIDKDKPRRPRLADLRSSGAIEQDADVVAGLWCDKPEDQDGNRDSMPTTLSILKQRNGPTDDVPLVFLKALMRHEPRYEGRDDTP